MCGLMVCPSERWLQDLTVAVGLDQDCWYLDRPAVHVHLVVLMGVTAQF